MGRMKALVIEQMNEEEDTQFNLELENEAYILIEELKQKIKEQKKNGEIDEKEYKSHYGKWYRKKEKYCG